MNFDTNFIFSYLFLLIIVTSTEAEVCKKSASSSCSCTTSTNVIDLTPLSTSTNPRFSVTAGAYTYSYQPCIGLTGGCGQKDPTAVCQEGGSSVYNAGLQASAQFIGDPALNNLQVKYTGPKVSSDIIRTSTISLVCDKATDGSFVFNEEKPLGHFIFTLRTKYACINSAPSSSPSPSPSPSHGLSTGSVLLILFFVFLAVYFIGGILFMKFMRGAQGAELIPNFEFWTALPGLVKDGVLFTSRGCKKDESYSQI